MAEDVNWWNHCKIAAGGVVTASDGTAEMGRCCCGCCCCCCCCCCSCGWEILSLPLLLADTEVGDVTVTEADVVDELPPDVGLRGGKEDG